MELDSWKKALAHCRSCHCFPVSLKWNTLALFIICYSIMNVWKVERAAVIYLQGIRGERAVLGKPEQVMTLLECRKVSLATRLWNKTLSQSQKYGCIYNKFKSHTHSSTLSSVIDFTAYTMYARIPWNAASLDGVTNNTFKGSCIVVRAALWLIFFLMV